MRTSIPWVASATYTGVPLEDFLKPEAKAAIISNRRRVEINEGKKRSRLIGEDMSLNLFIPMLTPARLPATMGKL